MACEEVLARIDTFIKNGGKLDMGACILDLSEEMMKIALIRGNFSMSKAAAMLGIRRTTFVEKVKKLGLREWVNEARFVQTAKTLEQMGYVRIGTEESSPRGEIPLALGISPY